jgi:hypothetical protein
MFLVQQQQRKVWGYKKERGHNLNTNVINLIFITALLSECKLAKRHADKHIERNW